MKKIIFASCVTALTMTPSISVMAAEGAWTEGFGQGNLEYFTDKQGFRLYIGCPTEDGSSDSKASVSLSKISGGSEVKKFTITAAGVTYEAPFTADSRVGDNNFISLLESLHKTNALVKFGNKSINFPKSNAAKVIPLFGAKTFSCNLSF